MSSIFSPLVHQTICKVLNYTFIWKFNLPGSYRCEFYLIGDNKIFFTEVICYDVYYKLEHLVIKTKSKVRTNETFYSTLLFFPNLSFTNPIVVWNILNQNNNTTYYIRNHTNYSKTFVFGKPGRYIINAAVSNPVSKVQTQTPVFVQDPISGLTLKPSKPTLFTKQNSSIPFHCHFATGTDVTCIWTISCDNLEGHHKQTSMEVINCTFVLTFTLPGHCRISLFVKNKITSIRVPKPWNVFIQHPIIHLQVSCPKFAIPGSTATINVHIPNVSNEIGTITVSNVRAVYEAGTSVYKSEVTIGHRIGLQWVRVRAHNNVSRVVERWPVLVVAEVGQVSVQPVGCLAVGHSAMFLVQIDGK